MKRQDYLDHNLNKLFKCTDLKLHMPADRKANALNRLLQHAKTPTEYELKMALKGIRTSTSALDQVCRCRNGFVGSYSW